MPVLSGLQLLPYNKYVYYLFQNKFFPLKLLSCFEYFLIPNLQNPVPFFQNPVAKFLCHHDEYESILDFPVHFVVR